MTHKKVINEEEYILYHASNADFDKFDSSKIGQNYGIKNYLGAGFYFTDNNSPSVLFQYGNIVYKVKVNFDKLFDVNKFTDENREILDYAYNLILDKYKGTEEESYVISNYNYWLKKHEDGIAGNYITLFIKEWGAEKGIKVSDILQHFGYDGIVDSFFHANDATQYMAFPNAKIEILDKEKLYDNLDEAEDVNNYLTQEEAKKKYLEYLEGHIGNVKEAFELLCTLDIPFINDNKIKLEAIVSEHDASKYEEPEWTAYLHHFYPTCNEDSLKTEEFEEACRHHVHSNPHHWDYWTENGELINDISEEEYKLYTVERLCDHMAMSIQNDNKPSDWYFANKENIIMPDYGYELYEEMLEKLPDDYDLSFHGTRTDGKPERETVNEDAIDDYIEDLDIDETSIFNNLDNQISEYYKYIRLVGRKINKAKTDAERNELKRRQDFYKMVYDRLKSKKKLQEDLYMNKEVVDSLGKRVKKSKTSNTIEIDTSMTNHDRQLKEQLSMKERKEIRDLYIQAYSEYAWNRDVKNISTASDEKLLRLKASAEKAINATIDRYTNSQRYIDDMKNIEVNKKKEEIQRDEEYKRTHDKEYSFEEIDESVLTEMKLSQIKQKSKSEDPERVNRSRKVKTTYLGMSKFGILNFKTTSQSRSGHHYQTLEFKDMKPFEDIVKQGKEIMPMDVKKQLQDQDVNVFCTDESFSYWAWAHSAYKNDFLYIDDRIPDLKKRIQAPKVNNVRLNGGSCKHILSVIDYCTRPFVLLAISQDMNKFLAGTQEDKMSKQSVATQNQYDAVADWDWSDIEECTGLSRIQIMSDISKTLQIIPNIDKGDIITDIVGEALPNDEQGLKRDIVDKIEDLINNMEE